MGIISFILQLIKNKKDENYSESEIQRYINSEKIRNSVDYNMKTEKDNFLYNPGDY